MHTKVCNSPTLSTLSASPPYWCVRLAQELLGKFYKREAKRAQVPRQFDGLNRANTGCFTADFCLAVSRVKEHSALEAADVKNERRPSK